MRFVVLVLVSACANKDWRVARAADTSTAWRTYAHAHAGEPRAEVAYDRASARAWDEAVAAATSNGYLAYIAGYPTAPHVKEARIMAEQLGWEEAASDGSVQLLSAYVSRYPKSPHMGDAKALIEERVYEAAKADGIEGAWSQYVARYPFGAHVDEANLEIERLAWAYTVAEDDRITYRRYIERFPNGPNRATADAWLRASYVRSLQPVVALIGTWHGPADHGAVLERVETEVSRALLDELGRVFTVRKPIRYDGNGGFPHPHELVPVEPDLGVLVFEYTETKGRAFEPSGFATDVRVVVRLYAPNSKQAVWYRELHATTPDQVKGDDATALHLAAVRDFADQLPQAKAELALQRPSTGGTP